MVLWLAALLIGVYAAGTLWSQRSEALAASAYPSPGEAEQEMEALAARHARLCRRFRIGRSSEGRPIHAFRLRAASEEGGAPPARLLLTAQIHAIEFVGSLVARRVARRLLEGYGGDDAITALLGRAEIWVVPLLNPDGAARVWRRRGRVGLSAARVTVGGVDPNRNFPFRMEAGRGGWNTARARPGSAYYRGPHPLSEPECVALAQLAAGISFCAAVNLHSFGGVVYIPEARGPGAAKAERVLAAFHGPFQSRQPKLRYRPVVERRAKIAGQLDAFLLDAFGVPSVTVEVSRPGPRLLKPTRLLHPFYWANPERPDRWLANDVDAIVFALGELAERSGGTPCEPAHPGFADQVPPSASSLQSQSR